MMTYLAPRNTKSRWSGFITVVIVMLVVIAGLQFFFPYIFSGFFTSLARPFWRLEFSLESGALKSPESLLAENEELKRQLVGVDARLQTVAILEQENAELKAAFGRSTSTPRLLAAVLKRPPLAPYDEFIIDVGKDYAIASGTPVYTSEGIHIGTITYVLAQTSTVRLHSSPGQTHEVLIGPDKEPATAIGRGGGQYEASVPREAPIQEGDQVLNSSLGSVPFGLITARISDPAEAFEKVLFAPTANIYKLRWVIIKR